MNYLMNKLEELLQDTYDEFRSPDDVANLLITLSGSEHKTVTTLGLPEKIAHEFKTELDSLTSEDFKVTYHSPTDEPHAIITIHNTNYEPNIGYLRVNQEAHKQDNTISLSSLEVRKYDGYEYLGITACMIRQDYDEELVRKMIDRRKNFVQGAIKNPPVSQSFITKAFLKTVDIRLSFFTNNSVK